MNITDDTVPHFDFNLRAHGHVVLNAHDKLDAIKALKAWENKQDADFVELAPWASGRPKQHRTLVSNPAAWAGHLIAARDEMQGRYEALPFRTTPTNDLRPLYVVIDEAAFLFERHISLSLTERAAINDAVSDICRMGRAVRVHLVAITSGSARTGLLLTLQDVMHLVDVSAAAESVAS